MPCINERFKIILVDGDMKPLTKQYTQRLICLLKSYEDIAEYDITDHEVTIQKKLRF